MLYCTFASMRPDCPQLQVSVTSGGSTTVGGSMYLALVGINRVGVNRPSRNEDSTFLQVTWEAGQKVVVTIPSSARTAMEEVHRFVLVGSDVANTFEFEPLAWWRGYDLQEVSSGPNPEDTFYEEVRRALPDTIQLTHDAHFQLGGVVGNANNLQAIPSPRDGMVRWVTPLANYFYYDPTSTATPDGTNVLDAGSSPGNWLPWIFPSDFRIANISDVTGERGCSRDVRQLEDTDILFLPPRYKMDGSRSNPVTYWLSNGYEESGSDIESGTRVSVEVFQGGQSKSTLFSQRLVAEIFGYVRLSTAALDIEDLTVDTEVTYFVNRPLYTLEKNLPPGWAVALSVAARFREEELGGWIDGSSISMTPRILAQAGDYVPGWRLTGNAIYNDGNRRRIYPMRAAKVKVGSGSGVIQRLEFELRSAFDLYLPVTNLSNLKITVNGNGDVFYRGVDTLGATEALRAIVGMATGRSNPGTWSNYVFVADNQSLVVECAYPSAVRSDYPDVIAGSSVGELNPTNVVLYVQRVSDSQIREFPNQVVLPGSSQSFTITDFAAGTVIDSLPTTDGNFGFFAAGAAVSSVNTSGGAMAFDNYRACYAFRYNGNTVSSITHSEGLGCVYEAEMSLADIFAIAKYWAPPVANFAALPASAPVGQIRETVDDKSLYSWSGTAWVLVNSRYWAPPVANFAALPVSAPTNQVRMTANDGSLYRFDGTTWTGISGGGGGGISPVADVAALMAIASPSGWKFLLSPRKTLVYFDADSTRTHNGTTVWKPTSIDSGSPGRWECYMQPSYRNVVVEAGEVVTADGEIVTTEDY